ncbi:hypothetical protein ACLB2K_061895 [Fragaria x ananassa]
MAAEKVLTFAAEGILTRVSSLASQELAPAWGFKAELEKLGESVSTIQDFLRGAADQRPDDEGKKWVKKLKQVAEDADDILDDFNYELLRRKVELHNHMKRKVLNFLSASNPLLFRVKMAHKIKKINDSLVELKKEAPSNNKGDSRQRPDRGQTDSFFEYGEKVVGREDAVTKIVTTLISSDNQQKNLSVMAIVGMAGLGKTTLAKSVYNEPAIGTHFDKRIWVFVSNTFEVDTILSLMVETLVPEKAGMKSRDAILEVLIKELTGKRYVLVLDDVWNEEREKWEDLMSCLSNLNSNPGSCIIVTTRSTNVSTIAETLPRPELRKLSEEDCWSIIKQRALNLDEIDAELERIGREIAEKCGGLPLVAKVLGSLLRSRASTVEWLSIRDNRLWELPEGVDRIMKVFKLSFDNLESSPLKQCFAYCSMLRKDFEIERDNLIQLWMAQGLLQTSNVQNHHEMEHTGKVYFNILLNNSLFQEVIEGGTVTKYKMHNLVHNLAEKVSESECLTQVTQELNDDVRHVARSRPPSTLENMSEVTVGRLRSLFSNDPVPDKFFKAMRVLSLDTAGIKKLPDSFGKLKHLRYLDLSNTRIEVLPTSIGKLYNLQTLRLQKCDLNKLPREMQNLINLRHLYVDKKIEFPAGMFRGLTNLRTLSCFNVGEEMGCRIEELGGLNQLKGMLTIRNLENVRDEAEAKKAKLEKKNVVELRLVFSAARLTSDINDENVLEGLQPHTQLESLRIKGFMGDRFPSWMMSNNLKKGNLINLKKLVLVRCSKCGELPILGHLRYLRDVQIKGMDNLKRIGSEIYGFEFATREKETIVLFPALKTLSIEECPELIEWMEAPTTTTTTKVEVFPCLEELTIDDCPSIGFIPIPYSMASLRKLRIELCDELSSIDLTSSQCLPSLHELRIKFCSALSSIGLTSSQGLPSLRELRVECCNALSSIGLTSSQSLPSLRELIIKWCEGLSALPSGIENCTSLELLEVCGCHNLATISFTRVLPSLREVRIERCNALSSIGLPSSQGLPSLRELIIRECEGLSALPSGIENCTSLELLEVCCCHNLATISFIRVLPSLREVRIERCNALSSIGLTSSQGLPSLRELIVRECEGLSALLRGIENCTSLVLLEVCGCHNLATISFTRGLPSLRELRIERCNALSSIGLTSSQGLPSLRELIIRECEGLSALPSGIENCTSLELLEVCGCHNLATISFTRVLPSLRELRIERSLPSGIENCTSLELLEVCGCHNLATISFTRVLPSLRKLEVAGCGNLSCLAVLEYCPSLQELSVRHCPGLQSLPDFRSFTSLRDLGLGPFWEDLDSFPDFQVPSQLVSLHLNGWPKLKSLPQEVQHLTSLTRLGIWSFNGVETLPEWLGNLASLVELNIRRCDNLKYLPSLEAMQRLTKLQELHVDDCPLLEERCTEDSGEEWPKISHIPDIESKQASL